MNKAIETLQKHAHEQGWNDASKIELLTRYIDSLRALDPARDDSLDFFLAENSSDILTKEKEDSYNHPDSNQDVCPFCDSRNLMRDAPRPVDDAYEVPIVCGRCKRRWKDVLEFDSIKYDGPTEGEDD